MIGSLTNGGLGYSYYDLLNSVGGYEQCDPRDAECVLRNQEKQVQVSSFWEANSGSAAGAAVPQFSVVLDTGDAALDQFRQNDVPNYIDPIVAKYNPTVVAQGYGMTATPSSGGNVSFQFTTSRGGSGATVYPGDTWQMSASGGVPGSNLFVSGTMKGVAFSGSPAGQFDGSGKWSKSGTFSAGDIGVWTQQYTTQQGVAIGNANFTVKAPATVVVPTTPLQQTTNTGNTVVVVPKTGGTTPGSSGQTNPTVDDANTTNRTVFDLFGTADSNMQIAGYEVGNYTLLALVALVGGGVYLMTKRGK